MYTQVKRAPEEDDDFPEFDDHTTEKPQSKGIVSRLGQMLNGILQVSSIIRNFNSRIQVYVCKSSTENH